MHGRLTQLFERYRDRYALVAPFCVVVEVLFFLGPATAFFPAHYEGLSVGQYLVVFGSAVVAGFLIYGTALFVFRRGYRALVAWCDDRGDEHLATARAFAFDGPRRIGLLGIALGIPVSPLLVLLLASPHHHTTALDWLELSIGALTAIGLASVSAWFSLDVLFRPIRAAIGELPPEARTASLVSRLALVIPTAIWVSAFAVGYLTSSRASAGAGHLMVIYAIAVGCTFFCLILVGPLFVGGVVAPFRELAAATRAVAAGRFDTRVPIAATDELGRLATSFNRMLEELQASRGRIVAAADEERRRVERDLHDGAQQQLVLIALKAGAIERLVAGDPKAGALAHELRADVYRALSELRDLARGLYPAALESDGLPGALADAVMRAPIPTTVECDGAGRYRAELETAVYFCCLEALQNAAKHAGEGARARITLGESDDALRFEVTDDGSGFDAAATPGGSGLQNMTDRIGALGGNVRIDSEPGRGTTIVGQLPVGEP